MTATDGHFSVQAASAAAGITPTVLRMWEHRYAVVAPERTPSGHRRYDQAAVDRLCLVAALVRQGHAVGAVATLDDGALRQLLTTVRDDAGDRLPLVARGRLEELREAIIRYDIASAASLLRWLRTALGARTFVLDVTLPLFATVGALVAESKLDVSQEHALSAVIRDQLGDLLNLLQSPTREDALRPPIVFAAPEDDRHEFGALLGAVLGAVRGLRVWFGGADLPAANLANAVRALKAPAVVLGNAPVPPSERRISFEQYLLAVDAALPAGVSLYVGGAGDRPRAALPSGRSLVYLNSLEELDAIFEGLADEIV